MSQKLRIRVLVAVVVAVVLVVGGYVANEAVEAAHRGTSAGAERSLADAGTPRVFFRNTDDRGTSNGLMATVPLDDLSGDRTIIGPNCDRVAAAGDVTVCLSTRGAIATTFQGQMLDTAGKELKTWPLVGIPSRTRMSPSGRLVADTSFINEGTSYAQVGFSTATFVRKVDGPDYANLESFTAMVDGRRLTARDRNFWGVTFAAGDRFFYATAASGGRTWLVRGDLSDRTLTSVRRNAECPSLSPDGRRIAYKKRVPENGRHWSLAVLDLQSGRETVLREHRSADDQLEWLNDDTLLYALPRSGRIATSDVWSIAATSAGRPRLTIEYASSPAVAR